MSINNLKTLIYRTSKGVSTVTLNRPEKKNALNDTLVFELSGLLDELSADTATKILILEGAGDAFCSGADLAYLKNLKDYSYDENLKDSRSLAGLFLKIYEFPKLTIAKVNGPAIAGGCGLATLCDFVFATERSKFGYPEVKIGFVAAIVSVFLIRQIGERKARELLLSGKILSAEESLSFGLINKVLLNSELDTYIADFVSKIIRNSPQAVKRTKSLLNSFSFELPVDALDELAKLNAEFRQTSDFSEGVNSFLEKRKPNWI
jgi:methylglutaconyl-CoA hydratase